MIYFAFSDEVGDYKPDPGKRFLNSHPMYSRSSVIISAEQWFTVKNEFEICQRKLPIINAAEIKWSHVWSLKRLREAGKEISEEHEVYFLKNISNEQLQTYVRECLGVLTKIDAPKIIITVTYNNEMHDYSVKYMLKFHLQEHMQRIEMDIQSADNNLCILFIDSINTRKDKMLREVYHDIFIEGDFINKYGHIKDSLNLELSHHSAGIQLADFISGCFTGFLRGWNYSTECCKELILPYLRKNEDGEVMGYGIREVPRNDEIRAEIDDKLRSL